MTREEFKEMVTFHGKDKRSYTPPAHVLLRAFATLAEETADGWTEEEDYWVSVDGDWDINMCRPVEGVNEGWLVGLYPVFDNSTCCDWDCVLLDYECDDPEDDPPAVSLHAYLFTDREQGHLCEWQLNELGYAHYEGNISVEYSVATSLNLQTEEATKC